MTLCKQQRVLSVYRNCLLPCILVIICYSQAVGDVDWGSLSLTPIKEMQAVNADGSSAWGGPGTGYKFRGVVLNDPAQMLDGTPSPDFIGGQWQIFVQAVLGGDYGGMALWMGQNYGNLPWINDPGRNYSEVEWTAELNRLNYPIDMATGLQVSETLRPGDLIEVHARAGMTYKGKFNCNEEHWNTESKNFDIYLIGRDQPLSSAEISLENIKHIDDTFIFDSSRLTGGEFYQGQSVRLQNVTITNPENWGAYGTLNVTDGTRNFAVILGDNASFDGTSAPGGPLDITGIFDQDSSDSIYSTDGYRMWALTPSSFVAVPEPGGLLLLFAGSLLFIVLRKRH